jgi:tetratricopeptide (TPR) repeat protein
VSAAAPLLEPPVSFPPLRAVGPERTEAAELLRVADEAVSRARWEDAAAAFGACDVSPSHHPDLALRALLGECWARLYLGELDEALALATRGRALSELPELTDADRADAIFRLGCVRLKRSEVALALCLFSVALDLCDRSRLGCDRLRARILEWRARGYQIRRDWTAAQADVERALELAQSDGDEHTRAHVLFQASLVAERTGQTLLACFYAEEARELFERAGDRQSAGRLLNNLGGLNFLLGRTDEAVAFLKRAIASALDLDATADAAQAISSLAQVHLRTGAPDLAEAQARHALELLSGRDDFVDEIGNAQLVLGRALLDQSRFDEAAAAFAAADASFERLSSTSHRAAVWTAQGDLARAAGDCDGAADLYRRAVDALQDFHF